MALRIGACCLLVAVLAAAAPSGERTRARTCAQRAESDSSDPVQNRTADDLFIAHRLLLAGLRGVKTQDIPANGVPGKYWFKALAEIRTGRDITLSVPASERGRWWLAYSNDRGENVVRLEPCRPTVRRFIDGRPVGNWTLFPGGFLYREAGCYTLQVRIEGRRNLLRYRFPLGAGARC
jgi:hypothetical protein